MSYQYWLEKHRCTALFVFLTLWRDNSVEIQGWVMIVCYWFACKCPLYHPRAHGNTPIWLVLFCQHSIYFNIWQKTATSVVIANVRGLSHHLETVWIWRLSHTTREEWFNSWSEVTHGLAHLTEWGRKGWPSATKTHCASLSAVWERRRVQERVSVRGFVIHLVGETSVTLSIPLASQRRGLLSWQCTCESWVVMQRR